MWSGLAEAARHIAFAAEHQTQQPIRIMPLGDSITESTGGSASYRYYLWQALMRKDLPVSFVGSMKGVSGGAPLRNDFDQRHEGHSGWRADEVLSHITSWAEAANPDIVLVHLGTNDLWQGQSAEETADDIAGVIERLRKVNSRVEILLAQIIPSSLGGLRDTGKLNERLAAVAQNNSRSASAVLLVDLATGFDPRTMTVDGVHPNEAGEQWMAERWAAALVPLLQARRGSIQ
jgi:lysophospholipase L1-like esterase